LAVGYFDCEQAASPYSLFPYTHYHPSSYTNFHVRVIVQGSRGIGCM